MTIPTKTIVKALFTCSQWWSDHGSGLSLLSLGSTYKLHSGLHRRECLRDIDENLAYVRSERWHEPEQRDVNIKALERLRALVLVAKIGAAWIDDKTHMQLNEHLYQTGQLIA